MWYKKLQNKKYIYIFNILGLVFIIVASVFFTKDSTIKKDRKETESNDVKDITPLDITEIDMADTNSTILLKFSDYSSMPMKYNNTENNGAVEFRQSDWNGNEELTGWIQIFNLKDQGVETDDACITYNYKTLDLDKVYGKSIGRTTIIPVYNYNTGKEILYKKYCLGVSKYGYQEANDIFVSARINGQSNVYEWIDDKWNYVGKFETTTFDERNPLGNMYTYELSDYVNSSYEWIQKDQKSLVEEEKKSEYQEFASKVNEFGEVAKEKYIEMAINAGCTRDNIIIPFKIGTESNNLYGNITFQYLYNIEEDKCQSNVTDFDMWYTQNSAPLKEEYSQLMDKFRTDMTDYTVLYEK